MKIGYLTIMIFTNLLAVGIFHADYENAQTDALIILFTGMASIFVIWKQGQNCTLGLNTTKKFKNSLIYV